MEDVLTVRLTVEQASELFTRCLASTLDDTAASVEAMQLLAEAMYARQQGRRIELRAA